MAVLYCQYTQLGGGIGRRPSGGWMGAGQSVRACRCQRARGSLRPAFGAHCAVGKARYLFEGVVYGEPSRVARRKACRMCNLYTMTATVDELRRLFGPFDGDTANLPPFDVIFLGRAAPVVRSGGGEVLVLETMTWVFPGPAAAGGHLVTNVRNLQSPFWRSALSNSERRCIVPATKFCEWTADPDPVTKRKSKIWFGMHEAHHPLFAFAGLWRPGEGGPFMAFLTCDANATVGAVHPKAMPVMMRPADALQWLEGGHEEACALALPFPDADMRRIEAVD